MKKSFALIVILIQLPLWAQTHSSATAPKEKQKDFTGDQFKPHMIDHFNQGCPANSECSPQMGKLYKRWTDSLENFASEKQGHRLLERFREKNGVPFEVWTTPKTKPEDGVIFWDSPCQQHNFEGQSKFGIGIVMIKDLADLKKRKSKDKVILRYLKHYQADKKNIRSFMTLRGETPLYIEKNNLIYQKMDEGQSYGLSVSSKGKLRVVKTVTPKEFPRSIDCPKPLVEERKKLTPRKDLYSGFYCQKIWNKTTDKLDTVMVGWSCN